MVYILALICAAVSIVVFANILHSKTQDIIQSRKIEMTEFADQKLADMFIFVDSDKLWRASILLSIIFPLFIYIFLDSPFFAVIGFIASLVMPKKIVEFLRKKREKKFITQLPDALLMLSGAMKAGASFGIALESMVKEQKPPISQEFDLLVRQQRLGIDFDTALRNMEERMPIQDFIMVISAMRISRDVGGNLTEVLDSLATTLRRKFEMEAKIDGLTAQGKLQGIVMSSLPLLLMWVLTKMEPEAMAPMFNTWYGWVTLGVIMVAEYLAYFVISKIVNIDV
jgi:tight adherence protein B